MKKLTFLMVLMGLAIALSSGCASMQTRTVYDRSTETKMIVIQEKVEDGLKSGVLTPDQSRMYLDTLKDIRTDYAMIKDKSVSRDERNRLQGRLDVLGDVINKALAPPKKTGEPADSFWERVGRDLGVLPRAGEIKGPLLGDRVLYLQKKIDDGRSSGIYSLSQAEEFQAKLDTIRSNYFLATEGGRSATIEEKEVFSRLLDSLESDLRLFPLI